MTIGTIHQIEQQYADLLAEAQGLLESPGGDDGDLSAEQAERYNEITSELDKLKARMDRARDLEAREQALAQRRFAERDEEGRGNGDRPGASGHVRPGGPEARREFENFGEFMYAVRFQPNDQRLSGMYAEQRMDDGSSGGFAVPTQFRGELMEVSPQEAIVRPRATVIPAGTPPDSEITMPALDQTSSENMYGGVSVDWIGEGGDKPETDAHLREITLRPHEVAAHVALTDKLLRNWPAASSLIARLLRNAVIAAEDDNFFSGDGVAKPHGVIESGGAYTHNRNGANAIAYTDVENMFAHLLMRGGSPVWVASQSASVQLTSMEDTEGHLIWQPNARESVPGNMLGYPLAWNERSPTLGNKGDLSLLDLSYYLIKDGSGPFVAASEHVHFKKNKTVVKITWNVDGQGWLTEPITQENGSHQVSPFVVLDVP